MEPLPIREILQTLEQEYPQTETDLHYSNPFELLLAVILSAQTTDKQVNKITQKLFPKIKGPHDILNMGALRLENEIKKCGLYRRKSRHIMETSRLLCDKFGGVVPQTRKELMTLPGVGRKTANVVLSTGFGLPAFAVDTHVRRVSRRLGLSRGKNDLAVEKDVCRLVPKELWRATHRRLISHGRKFCRARNPLCKSCPLNPFCPSAGKITA
ncbi:MAG: endonuclease III [Firmicutes bacterium]|nr:endonuclease III [Bacillota bacterium]